MLFLCESIYCFFLVYSQLVGESLLWTLGQGLGKDFTSETKEAWTAMYGLVSKEMKTGLQEYKELTGSLEC